MSSKRMADYIDRLWPVWIFILLLSMAILLWPLTAATCLMVVGTGLLLASLIIGTIRDFRP